MQAPTPENENDAMPGVAAAPKAACAKIALMLRGLEKLAAARDLSNADRASARTQVLEIAGLLSQSRNRDLIALHDGFLILAERLAPIPVEADGEIAAPDVAPLGRRNTIGKRLSRELRRLAVAVTAMVAAAAPTLAAADPAPPPNPTAAYHVDDLITNPATGQQEEIAEIVNAITVRTESGNLILVPMAAGTTFTVADQGTGNHPDDGTPDPAGTSKTYTVESVDNTDPAHPKLKVKDASNNVVAFDLVTPLVNPPAGSTGSTDPNGALTSWGGAGDIGNRIFSSIGANGKNGADGGGVRICFGWFGCVTVGKEPGNGGDGGNGQTVTATVYAADGPIKTATDKLAGIFALSQGGSGGTGGNGYGYVISGRGGKAGAGGDVDLTNQAQVVTTGKGAAAIFAQSRAGTGGNGGDGYGLSDGAVSGAAAESGDVRVYNTGYLHTVGYGSAGISAQSLGGGAGTGGSSYGIVAGAASGSTGGNAGGVYVENDGAIVTGDEAGWDFNAAGEDISGYDAYGIIAQSIGGSGGSAGDGAGIVSLGDTVAGAGGDGGTVTVVTGSGSSIHTYGKGATGIMAQSIGGGGGAGGYSIGLVALGAKGGSGGDGGTVTVQNAGWITTEGDFARGVLAQSIGGGGGAGSDAGGLVSLGGNGGAAADGGDVSVSNTGAINTSGDHSSAVQAQSIGGGGGDGGSSGGVFLTIGGSGNIGGKSGSVTVTHGGAIHTKGDDSNGIFAESIGGGGGSGGTASSISVFAGAAIGGQGASGGDGGAVRVNLVPISLNVGGSTVSVDPTIDTEGDRSRGIFAQSVGGGGGAGGFASALTVGYGAGASAAIGGDGSVGGKGGAVWIEGDASITTKGDNAEGIFAQSVGGGGGAGGYALSLAVAASQPAGAAFAVGIGGQGGGGGDGGQVDILSGGSIDTDGRFSTGLVAQSVGGGGGTGGYALAFSGAGGVAAAVAASVGVGGQGGSGGDGGAVGAAFEGKITTHKDDSKGALIQSVGGGGGDGGYAISGAMAVSSGDTGAGSAGVGGSGGSGGAGGSVSGYVGGDITTSGDRSTGLVVQSVGGGGGAGGFAVAGSLSAAVSGAALGVGVGGVGGGGGDGGDAYGSTGGVVTTGGDQSVGVLVQSVGGGGGSGGFNVSGALSLSATNGGTIGVGLGGAGGGGGDGAGAVADIGDDVVTYGDQSVGVIVQSVGGGGGSGGFNISGGVDIGAGGGLAVAVGLGGSGGGGGDGGAVEASAHNIHTEGDQSGGFLAQSVGGGGGSGGFNISGAASAEIASANALTVGLGGSGGQGGAGGTVKVTLSGLITTLGDRSDAVVVQSVGGGGGSGGIDISGALAASGTGAASLGVGLGGSGGGGGAGGAVEAQVDGVVATLGDDSAGVVAQSVGGGGGSGAFNISADAALSGGIGGAASVGLGGSGGSGGSGGKVKLGVNGVVLTFGEGAEAVLAQSTGGGGGDGGFNVSGDLSVSGTAAFAASVGVGGSGGGGGAADDVTLTMKSGAAAGGDPEATWAAVTYGGDADAVTAQSVGGGGGNGGFNVAGALGAAGDGGGAVSVGVGGSGGGGGSAGDVLATITGDIQTQGDLSHGLLAQSVGGGGGSGGFNVSGALGASGSVAGAVSVGVGGSGGGGGNGGAVTAALTGLVTTEGQRAFAIKAQSVGGGGGDGGFDVAGGLSASGGSAAMVSVGVGGSGGDGGDGGAVSLEVAGGASTQGGFSDAIVAQSLGGGGGDGGFNVSGTVNASTGSGGGASVGVGGSGGGGGDGAAVTLTASSQLASGTGDSGVLAHTEGAASRGVLAQSTGGGGGSGGFDIAGALSVTGQSGASVAVGVGGSGGDGGDGGTVQATVHGDVETAGGGSAGVTAQSVGGGGGAGAFNVTGTTTIATAGGAAIGVGVGGSGGGGGDGGSVDLDIIGQILTEGGDSDGVMAQSVGGGGGSGGFNVTGQMSITADAATNIGVGVGGSGGDGGSGGEVTLVMASNAASGTGDSNYAAYTKGYGSRGVVAQSVGGGGGSGGFDIAGQLSIAADTAHNVGVGIGGSGGDGGDAGAVSATIVGDVSTQGVKATGVLVQSQGGGGGAGGFNVTGGVTIATDAASVLVGIGGLGGGGGDAGAVLADLTGDVHTKGRGAGAVAVVSQGGGGGVGGMNVTGGLSVTAAEVQSGLIGVGVGGFGGGGGDGAAVTASLTGDIHTEGDDAIGALIQSLGGGGGAGAINVTGAINIASGDAGTVAMGLGGFGGAGGDAGDVTATLTGATQTDGHRSDGINVQSVGGSGGSGGLNVTGTISVSLESDSLGLGLGVGGFGGGGGDAGDVTATITGSVTTGEDVTTGYVLDAQGRAVGETDGMGSSGVVVQSLGGGGGSGGINVTGDLVINGGSDSAGRAAAIGIGGFGGDGGDAGEVTATIASTQDERTVITSKGDTESAVAIQSIGGGGGNGAINVSGSFSLDGSATLGVGGFGGGGGKGGDVTAAIDANLSAHGWRSRGLLVESLGGGGGDGGINIAGGIKGGSDSSEPVITFGVGGGGGNGDVAGDVSVVQTGDVWVQGVEAGGVLVRSIGGGGGDGGLNVTLSATNGSSEERGYALGVGIGGNGGVGADAGDISLVSLGDVIVNAKVVTDAAGKTSLASADFTGGAKGVSVMAIGGGGGSGGINVTGVVALSGSPLTIGVGGSGGAAGDGGDITVVRGDPDDDEVRAGSVVTFGDNSIGVYVESTGGGGGDAGINAVLGLSTAGVDANTPTSESLAVSMAIGGNGGASGDGGEVDVTNRGDISTDGANSDGLVVLSQGGGGGNANYNIGAGYFPKTTALALALGGDPTSGGDGGDITLVQDGSIVTKGDDSDAIIVQSLGGGGGNAMLNSNFAFGASNKLAIAIGREGGTGGAGGDLSIDISGVLDTTGDRSGGLYAQSIGGGGGKSGAISVGAQTATGSDTERQVYEAGMTIGLQGALGADGGRIVVTSEAQVVTRGDEARGLLAQSVGGGGGAGGMALNLIMSTFTGKIVLGGDGGTGGDGGAVDLTQSGLIWTSGDRSDGVLAQSVGGGGGVGGATVTIARPVEAARSDSSAGAMSIALGGSGGAGGVGGAVDVLNAGQIVTEGQFADGIRAQSVGGGGGVGGATMSSSSDTGGAGARTASRISAFINIGGSGGTGGTGGAVDVVNTGLIWTQGDYSSGVSANSIGGGGGDAGIMNDGATISSGDRATTRTALNIGGSGGTGGTGGDVTVTNRPVTDDVQSGLIVTEGKESYGIFAQSIGGGGGNGSSIRSINLITSGKGTTAASLNIGGAGGSGNTGGQVTVQNDGVIGTSGDGAHGILAQSIGGGGGNGGMVLTLGLDFGKETSSPAISVGGIGGDGGNGGDVLVENAGSIVTLGDNADGIVAQSIGGGGGNAGAAISASIDAGVIAVSGLVNAVLGAVGTGDGGQGGEVAVVQSGDITTLGEGSQAIVLQSINGGGGQLAFDITQVYGRKGLPIGGSNDPAATADPRVSARAGAEGATDMNAGSVFLVSSGTYQVGGANAAGIFNQSIGGGGGVLRVNLEVAATPEDDVSTLSALAVDPLTEVGGEAMPLAVDVALGGIDGARNLGGDLDNSQTGDILMNGAHSPGVLDQSIGGGGGRAVVTVDVAQGASVGPVSVALGGRNGTDEGGGAVVRDQQGRITTTGALGAGAILQSVGGGGGVADVVVTGADAATVAPTLSLGSAGGTDLSGGAVTARFDGAIVTTGDHAAGLLVQSIGAGGGVVNLTSPAGGAASLGATAGAAGDGGDVTLDQDGVIVTAGAGAHGVLLQSIGGGGGAVLGGGVTDVSLNQDNIGGGGDIAFTQTGGVLTTGAGAYGVAVQSLGGGGGWVDDVHQGAAGGEGAGGSISLNLADDIMAVGADGVAVFAQSQGSSGAGDIDISLSGVTRGGSGTGAGVVIDGGADNTLVNTGHVSATSNLAIRTSGGDDHVDNLGVVVGDVDLGGGDNSFVNQDGATFIAAHSIVLRETATVRLASARMAAFSLSPAAIPGGAFTNSGDFLMGLSAPRTPIDLAGGAQFANYDDLGDPAANPYYGLRVINTVAIDGDFVQTSTGRMAFDVAFGPYASDHVDVTGSASVAGMGEVTLTWLQDTKPVTLFASGSAVDNGLKIADTLAMDYRVVTGAAGVQLAFTPHFDQGFLNDNGQALGRHMNSAIQAGDSGGMGRLMALIGNLEAGQEAIYSRIFGELNPEPYLAPLRSQLYSANSFSSQLFDCASPGAGLDGKCAWTTIERVTSRGEADAQTLGAKVEGGRLRGGFERPLAGDWSLAAAVGYERLDRVDVDDMRSLAEGQGFNAGLGLKKRSDHAHGSAEMAFSLSGGWQWMDTTRAVEVFGPGRAEAQPESGYLRTDARFAYVVENGRLFVRPALNVWATGLHQQKFAEGGLGGLGGLGASGASHTQFIGTANPEVTLGFVMRQGVRSQTAVAFRVGGLFNTTDRIEMPFRLVGANPASEAARVGTILDRSAYTAGVDFHVIGDDRVSVHFSYDREFGDRTRAQSAGLDIRVRF